MKYRYGYARLEVKRVQYNRPEPIQRWVLEGIGTNVRDDMTTLEALDELGAEGWRYISSSTYQRAEDNADVHHYFLIQEYE